MTSSIYHRQTAQFLAAVAQNIPEISGDVMQDWIQSPIALQEVLKTALGSFRAIPEFKVWKTIKLGTGIKTVDDFRLAFHDAKDSCGDSFKINDRAIDMIGKSAFKADTEEFEVDLVKVTIAELGFVNDSTNEQIYKRAQESGLELCPPEVGPQLRLQYKNQSNGEQLFIAMEPIVVISGTHMGVFSVECKDSEMWLKTESGIPIRFRDNDNYWVFVRPRKQ